MLQTLNLLGAWPIKYSILYDCKACSTWNSTSLLKSRTLLLTNEEAKCNAFSCLEWHCPFTTNTNIVKTYNDVPLEEKERSRVIWFLTPSTFFSICYLWCTDTPADVACLCPTCIVSYQSLTLLRLSKTSTICTFLHRKSNK